MWLAVGVGIRIGGKWKRLRPPPSPPPWGVCACGVTAARTMAPGDGNNRWIMKPTQPTVDRRFGADAEACTRTDLDPVSRVDFVRSCYCSNTNRTRTQHRFHELNPHGHDHRLTLHFNNSIQLAYLLSCIITQI